MYQSRLTDRGHFKTYFPSGLPVLTQGMVAPESGQGEKYEVIDFDPAIADALELYKSATCPKSSMVAEVKLCKLIEPYFNPGILYHTATRPFIDEEVRKVLFEVLSLVQKPNENDFYPYRLKLITPLEKGRHRAINSIVQIPENIERGDGLEKLSGKKALVSLLNRKDGANIVIALVAHLLCD